MDIKIPAIWLSVVSFLVSGVGYLLVNSYDFGLCFSSAETQAYDVSCHILYERIGGPLLYGMVALAIVFLILVFIPRAFGAWKKFAIWFVPLAALLFIFYPEPGSGDYFSPYPEQVFQWVSGLYVLVSLVIIGFSVLKARKSA